MPSSAQSVAVSARRLPGLDGVRSFAALVVFIDHVELDKEGLGLPNVWSRWLDWLAQMGVEIFFTLSGFLITLLLLREQAATGAISLRRFYVRRTLRIWPLYYAAVAVAFIVVPLAVAHAGPVVSHALAPTVAGARPDDGLPLYLVFLANVALALHRAPFGTAHLWTIGVEEQFYVAWPLLLRRFITRPLVVVAAVILGKIVATLVVGVAPSPAWLRRLVGISKFQAMAFGALAAWLAFHHEASLRPWLARRSVRALACILLPLALITYSEAQGATAIVLAPAVYAFVLLVVAFGRTPRLLERPAIVALGRISYGVYMFHTIIIMATLAVAERLGLLAYPWLLAVVIYPAALSIVVALAALSYRYLEAPLLRLGR